MDAGKEHNGGMPFMLNLRQVYDNSSILIMCWLQKCLLWFLLGACEKCGGKMVNEDKGNYSYFAEIPPHKVCEKCGFMEEV